jgi:hypothetical protein
VATLNADPEVAERATKILKALAPGATDMPVSNFYMACAIAEKNQDLTKEGKDTLDQSCADVDGFSG